MLYVGIDLSSKSFVVHAINERKRVVLRKEVAPSREGLRGIQRELGSGAKLVVFEAGNQLKWVADFWKKQEGVRLHVVHPNEVKWISSSSGKTDKVDARKLAELARADLLPRAVHVVEGTARQLRELTSARRQLMQKRVGLANTVRGYLKQEGVQLGTKFFTAADWEERLEKMRLSPTLKQIVSAFIPAMQQLEEAEQELTRGLSAVSNEDIRRLETIPGVGTISSRVLVGALDNVERFDDRKSVAKYGALTPTVRQSGDMVHLGRINRDGRHEIRRVLLQCAHTVARMQTAGSRPLRIYFQRLMRARGKKRAVVALARKLLTIAYGVLRSKTDYDPARLAPYPVK
jgi:transposase